MSILIYKDAKTVGVCAATMTAAHMLSQSHCVIGVDYHETLLPVYESLSAMTDNGLLVWNDVRVYQLFEFLPNETGEQRIANLLGKAIFAKTDLNQFRIDTKKSLIFCRPPAESLPSSFSTAAMTFSAICS